MHGPKSGKALKFGPYRREESRHQTKDDALLQVASGEIWGRVPMGGMEPTVQAYPGPLGLGVRGINFTTDIDPYPSGSPIEVRWYLTQTPGVETRQKNGQDCACIAADIANEQL